MTTRQMSDLLSPRAAEAYLQYKQTFPMMVHGKSASLLKNPGQSKFPASAKVTEAVTTEPSASIK